MVVLIGAPFDEARVSFFQFDWIMKTIESVLSKYSGDIDLVLILLKCLRNLLRGFVFYFVLYIYWKVLFFIFEVWACNFQTVPVGIVEFGKHGSLLLLTLQLLNKWFPTSADVTQWGWSVLANSLSSGWFTVCLSVA